MQIQPDDLDLGSLERDLPATVVGRPLLGYQQVESTNDLVRAHARADHDEGLVILAEEQTAGRGRLGRGWAAPPGSSLLMSLLLRPAWLAPAEAFALTMLAGVALCEAVEQVAPLAAALKWPNDLMLPGPAGAGLRKAAGVLSELEIVGGQIAWAAIGMGINVNWTPDGLVDGRDLSLVATSVSAASGRAVERQALLSALLLRLDARYLALRQGRREELFRDWRARLATLGQSIVVQLPQGALRGVAEDVEPSGALRLREPDGTARLILAGDVGV